MTDDGGESWRQAYVDRAYENPAGGHTPKGRLYRGNGLENTSSWWLHWTGQSTLIAAYTDIYGLRSENDGNTWSAGLSLGLLHNSTYHIIEHPITRTLCAGTSSVHDMYESAWLADERIDIGEGHVVMSSDKGKSWQLLKDFGHPVIWLAIDSEHDTMCASVIHSTDGGATWEDRSDPGMRRWTKDLIVDPHDPTQNTWYVAVFSHWGSPPNEVGGVYRTSDRGQNWTRISDLYRVESVAVHPDNPDILYASTESRGLWRTDNLTATNPVFTQVADYPFKHPVRMFFNPSNHDEVWVTSFGWGLKVLTP